ncbi:MAG: hypothetical protein IPP47_26475 [Bryobacterales bacterium]|nr:hypothetical protein [Bryobacterales bacterium]
MQYTLLVSNVGDAPSYGSYTVTDNPPTGLTVTAISGGQNWTCDLASRSCTPVQQGIIPPGGSAQPITVTADVAINAPADFINQATVSGGGDSTPGNNTASDPTHTTGPDLRLTKTHLNDFYQGQLRAGYELRVTNVGESEPTGNITITENPPAGMTIVEMGAFIGWSCNTSTRTCTAPPVGYTTPLTVTVNVSPTAAANLTNTATVSTAGDTNHTNDTASDPTVITPASPDLTITKSHVGNFARGQQGVQYTLLVSNVGDAPQLRLLHRHR